MLVAIALICQGCSFGGHRSSGTTIGPEGGHAATAFASVDAPAGAVTKLTKLHLTKGGADPLGGFSPDAGSMLDTPSDSIQVDLSGAQPQKPLTLSVPVPAGMDGTKAVLLSTHDGKPEALPTTPGAAGWVQASVSHLSPFRIAFLNFDKVGAFFRDAALFLGSAVGAAGTAQACANQPLQLAGGGTLSITGPTSPISVCLTSDSGGMHVSAQSADALPWRVRISKGTYDGAAEVSTSNVALQTAYNQLVKDRRFSEGLLAPQGKGSWHLTDDVADVTMQASVSTGMWLTSAVIFSAVYLFQVFTGAATKGVTGAAAAVKTVIDKGGYLDCLSSAVGAVPEGKILTAQQIGKLTKAGIDCAGPLIEQMGGGVSGLAAVVLTALGAGVAVVVSGFEGIFRTIKEPILTWHLTTTGRPAPSQEIVHPTRSFARYAGSWGGHVRGLKIDASGRGEVTYRTYNRCPGSTGYDPQFYKPGVPCDPTSGSVIFQIDKVMSADGNTVHAIVQSTNDPSNWDSDMSITWLHNAGPDVATVQINPSKKSPDATTFCDEAAQMKGVCGA
jgi:hypothetical protein